MFAQERYDAIRKIVRRQRRINFLELQKLVEVSPATLRRDLTELEAAGEIIRVHGGVLDPSYARTETSFDDRLICHRSAKKRIALCAAEMIPSGSTVLIDAGSTCLEAGKVLLGRTDIRLITHSVALLAAAVQSDAPMICLGGELRKVSGALTGGAALGALAALHADIALVGATGLDADWGCATTELSEAEMKKSILRHATRKILLADSSKWNQPSTVRFAEWCEFDDWITDKIPAGDQVKSLRAAALKIHQA